MAKQIRTLQCSRMMFDGAIARHIWLHNRWQWVIGIDQIPCSVAIRCLAGNGRLWIAQDDNGHTHAGLNKRGKDQWLGAGVVLAD